MRPRLPARTLKKGELWRTARRPLPASPGGGDAGVEGFDTAQLQRLGNVLAQLLLRPIGAQVGVVRLTFSLAMTYTLGASTERTSITWPHSSSALSLVIEAAKSTSAGRAAGLPHSSSTCGR